MSIIYVLIPVAILLTALGIYIFFWAVKNNQFNDLEKQGMSILFDDDKPKKANNQSLTTAPQSPSESSSSESSTMQALKEKTPENGN